MHQLNPLSYFLFNLLIRTSFTVPTGEETLQELEEDFQRMDQLRNVRRLILAQGGIVEIVLRNFDYYQNHQGAVRAGLRAISELTKNDLALQRLLDASIAEEKEYDRRLAGVKIEDIKYAKVEKKRGLGVLNSTIKEKLQPEENMSQNIDPATNKYVIETKSALTYVMEAELSPHLPLKFCRAISLFRDDDLIIEYAADISDAIRGIHTPIERLQFIIHEAQKHMLNKYSNQQLDEIEEDRKQTINYGSKYSLNIDEKNVSMHSSKKSTTILKAKYEKGDRVEARLKTYWRRRYIGTVLKVKRLKRSNGAYKYIYNIRFIDGEIINDVDEVDLNLPSLMVRLTLEESLRQILRIAAYPRWRTRPDIQTLCFRALKLVLDCGDINANQKKFVLLDGINITLSAMRLFPHSMRLNIRGIQLIISVILGPTRTHEAKMFKLQEQQQQQQQQQQQRRQQHLDIEHVQELQAKCAKSLGAAGAIQIICQVMRVNFLDEKINSTIRKQGVWALKCLAIDRNNIKIMEAAGAMYVLKLANQDKTIVIPRNLQNINWKSLREARLAGGINDEMGKLVYLGNLFVNCICVKSGMKCSTPSHCKQCFINKHAEGFWHKIGCKEHPGNTDVPSLLQMQQMTIAKKHHWANQQEEEEDKRKEDDKKSTHSGVFNAKILGLDAKKDDRVVPEEWL
jgi:hypothetical protein